MGLFSAVIDRSPIDKFGGNATAQSLLQQSQVAQTRADQLWDPNSIRNQLNQQQLMQNMHDLQAGQSLQASRLAAKTGGAGLATAAALNTSAASIGEQVNKATIASQTDMAQLAGQFSSQAGQFTSQAGSVKNQLNSLYRQQQQANQQARQQAKMARADAIMGVIGAAAGPAVGALGGALSKALVPTEAPLELDIEKTLGQYPQMQTLDELMGNWGLNTFGSTNFYQPEGVDTTINAPTLSTINPYQSTYNTNLNNTNTTNTEVVDNTEFETLQNPPIKYNIPDPEVNIPAFLGAGSIDLPDATTTYATESGGNMAGGGYNNTLFNLTNPATQINEYENMLNNVSAALGLNNNQQNNNQGQPRFMGMGNVNTLFPRQNLRMNQNMGFTSNLFNQFTNR